MRTIFNTSYGRAAALERDAKYALAYLLKNRRLVLISDQEVRSLAKLRGFQSTPMVDQFGKIAELTDLNTFSFIDVANADSDVPSILTIDEFSINGAWLDGTPDAFAKSWIVLTPVLLKKKLNTSGTIAVSDVSRCMGYVVRAHYVTKYAERDMFMSPTLAKFVIESYSMASGLRVSRMFNLDAEDAMMVQTAFAYHYAKLLGPEKEQSTNEPPTLLHRCGFLGSFADINERITRLHDAAGGNFYENGLVSMLDALAKVGPSRMNDKFNAQVFYRLFSIGTVDNKSMALGIDYPPYWVFMLLAYASGSKNGLMNNLFNLGSMRRQLDPFIDQLTKNRSFLEE